MGEASEDESEWTWCLCVYLMQIRKCIAFYVCFVHMKKENDYIVFRVDKKGNPVSCVSCVEYNLKKKVDILFCVKYRYKKEQVWSRGLNGAGNKSLAD